MQRNTDSDGWVQDDRPPRPIRYGGMRRFRLDREFPIAGRTEIHCIAQGVVFGDRTTVLRWLGDHPTTTIHPTVESVEAIHLHNGQRTRFRWNDPICWRCGACLEQSEWLAKHCFECGAGQGEEFCYDTRPEQR